jgi:hypothetical protein
MEDVGELGAGPPVKGILAIALATVLSCAAEAGQSKHKITVTFDYDFTHQPPCSANVKDRKEKKSCVQQFIVYDISAGLANRTELVSIPVPPDAHGLVKGISATTPLLLFESGQHLIAVVAQTPKKFQSDPNRCELWVTIPE